MITVFEQITCTAKIHSKMLKVRGFDYSDYRVKVEHSKSILLLLNYLHRSFKNEMTEQNLLETIQFHFDKRELNVVDLKTNFIKFSNGGKQICHLLRREE